MTSLRAGRLLAQRITYNTISWFKTKKIIAILMIYYKIDVQNNEHYMYITEA